MAPTIENSITVNEARRLFIRKQRLAGERLRPDKNGLLALLRELGCVQIDPISTVAPSHFLVLWSRLGRYEKSILTESLYKDRLLFEYLAHEMSIVLMEDYPLFSLGMRTSPDQKTKWGARVSKWLRDNSDLEQYIIRELEKKGPLSSRNFEDRSRRKWTSTGWTNNRNVTRMLQFLFYQGKLMVAGRAGERETLGSCRKLPS